MSDIQKQAEERPLEKMTVKALREMANKIPEITCVHGRKTQWLSHSQAKGETGRYRYRLYYTLTVQFYCR